MAEHPRDHDPLPNGHPQDCNCAECELLYGSTDPEVIAYERDVTARLQRLGLRSPVEIAFATAQRAFMEAFKLVRSLPNATRKKKQTGPRT